jgi:hypothetical protein
LRHDRFTVAVTFRSDPSPSAERRPRIAAIGSRDRATPSQSDPLPLLALFAGGARPPVVAAGRITRFAHAGAIRPAPLTGAVRRGPDAARRGGRSDNDRETPKQSVSLPLLALFAGGTRPPVVAASRIARFTRRRGDPIRRRRHKAADCGGQSGRALARRRANPTRSPYWRSSPGPPRGGRRRRGASARGTSKRERTGDGRVRARWGTARRERPGTARRERGGTARRERAAVGEARARGGRRERARGRRRPRRRRRR